MTYLRNVALDTDNATGDAFLFAPGDLTLIGA